MKTLWVDGTPKIFRSSVALSDSIPEFYSCFDSQSFLLTRNPRSDFFVTFNHNAKSYRQFLDNGGSIDRAVLIRLEPDSVFPAQYTRRTLEKYGFVISPGSKETRLTAGAQIGWPYKYHLNPANPVPSDPSLFDILNSESTAQLFVLKNWEKRGHLLTMVAGNKVSSITTANYSLRRNLAKSLPQTILEVYGPLWEGSLYKKIRHRLAVLVATIKQGTNPNLREIYGNLMDFYPTAKGPIIDKHALLQDSKFSLVIENSNSIVTEKIFDAIINGAIPIYVGPKLNTVGLPLNLAISVSGNPQEILKVLDKVESIVAEKHLRALSEFINSPDFLEHWEAGAVYRQMSLEIIQYLSKVDVCN